MEQESTPADAAIAEAPKKEGEEAKDEEIKEESEDSSTGEAKITPLLVHVSLFI